MHCVLVAGARPNFVKIAPVLAALEHLGARVELVHTGQHYDDSMSKVFFDDLNIRPPDHHLRVGSDSHARQTAEIMIGFETLLHSTEPDWVIVVGDVNSTVACGLVSAKSGIPLAHIEAGLRSRDWSMPEEINRVVTDRLSDVLFATSDEAAANLRSEGYRADQIELVGNVMVDSLLANLERAQRQPILEELSLAPRSYALATLHRPSNVDNEATLSDLMDALGQIALGLPVIFPAHPRTAQRLQALVIPENVQLLPPASYLAFIALESRLRSSSPIQAVSRRRQQLSGCPASHSACPLNDRSPSQRDQIR